MCSPFGQQPSPWDWSSSDPFFFLHQGPLLGIGQVQIFFFIKALSDGMVIVFFLYIKTLSDGMVIDFFLFIKTLSDGMVIDFFLYIKALSDGMVIDFLMFTSKPSPMEWSLIFLCLHQGPLRWNGH